MSQKCEQFPYDFCFRDFFGFLVLDGPTPCSIRYTKNPQIIPPSFPYENCSHFWDIFWKMFEHMSKHIFKPCSHIEFNTTNPNPILKITFLDFSDFKIRIRIHSSYFAIFGFVINFLTFVFLYFYIYIYITRVRSITRVGLLQNTTRNDPKRVLGPRLWGPHSQARVVHLSEMIPLASLRSG